MQFHTSPKKFMTNIALVMEFFLCKVKSQIMQQLKKHLPIQTDHAKNKETISGDKSLFLSMFAAYIFQNSSLNLTGTSHTLLAGHWNFVLEGNTVNAAGNTVTTFPISVPFAMTNS